VKDLGKDQLNVILQLCECYEELGDESDEPAAEMARIIRAIESGGRAAVMAGGRVASALSGRFGPDHPVWRSVVMVQMLG